MKFRSEAHNLGAACHAKANLLFLNPFRTETNTCALRSALMCILYKSSLMPDMGKNSVKIYIGLLLEHNRVSNIVSFRWLFNDAI
jgi:hypothetical protein